MWLTTYVGPHMSQIHICVQGQLWDCAILEQWLAAIVTLSLWAAHMALAGPHNMGIELIR